jgi:hypothetical protein
MWPCTGNLGRAAAVISSGSTRRDCSDPGIMHNVQGPGGAREESNKHIFLD